VKTAISLPEGTFHEATRRAAELGISRSELFVRAAQRYFEELDAASVTRLIDEALSDGPDESASEAVSAGRRVLGETHEW
jgi:hypothetical protein